MTGGSLAFKDMEDTQVEPRTKTLANGAIYDLDKGRIIANPGGGTAAITKENSSAYHARRQELKQQRILAGAAKALEAGMPGAWTTPDEGDVVEAIAEAVMQNALNPDSKKQIDAAKFILNEAGLSSSRERGNAEVSTPGAITADPETLMRLLSLMESETQHRADQARAVDAVATDTRNE